MAMKGPILAGDDPEQVKRIDAILGQLREMLLGSTQWEVDTRAGDLDSIYPRRWVNIAATMPCDEACRK